ncbi:LysM peptidoglycan-binding domain-containing protein [Psychromarinibacter sp. S121]|uniref:LysM peptidoglycan-binding domain-containing protein n=1 Tax=Psychromarinibacter sp. S121 TaxID=3415127 RepID=UPI003C7A6D33
MLSSIGSVVGGGRAAGAVIVVLIAGALGYGGWRLVAPDMPAGDEDVAEVSSADTPVADTPDVDETAASETPDAEPDAVAETAPETPEPPEAPETEPPVFDVVRVDAEGNALIAGRATPEADVTILLDGVEVSKTPAGTDGNFVSMFSVPPADVPRVMSLEMEAEGLGKVPSVATVILQPAPAGAAPEVAGLPEGAATDAAPDVVVSDTPDTTAPDEPVAEAPEGVEPDVATTPPADVAEVSTDGDTASDAVEMAGADETVTAEDTGADTAADTETAAAKDMDADVPDSADIADAAETEGEGGDIAATVAGTVVAGAGAAVEALADGLTGEPGPDSDETAAADETSEDPASADTATDTTAPDSAETAPEDTAEATTTEDSAPVETEAETAVETADASSAPDVSAPEAPEIVAPDVAAASEAPQVPDNGNAPDVPAAPSVLLADDTGIRVLQSGGAETRPNPTVEIDTITYDPEGDVAVGGRGGSGGFVRVYIDNRPVKTTEIGVDGQWTMDLPDIDTGIYTLRVDELDAEGAVVSRVETPFKREEPELLAALETSRSGGDADAPRPELLTVQPGNTLWGIASKRYGDGMLYVRVFEANKERIRDPHWIYPGQVFAIPE